MAGFGVPPSKVAVLTKQALDVARAQYKALNKVYSPSTQHAQNALKGQIKALEALDAAMRLYDISKLERLAEGK